MGGAWRFTLGDGPNESGLQLHFVCIRGGGGPPPRGPLRCRPGMGGAWRFRLGDGPNESGLQPNYVC